MTEPEQKERRGRRYSDEFKRHAVDLATSTSASVAKVSEELGVTAVTLSRWIEEFEQRLNADGRPSYEEIERELARLKLELNFLKKASSYFASQQPTGIR